MKSFKDKKTRTAVILCGGKGTRLGSITKKIPKSLVKIKDKAIDQSKFIDKINVDRLKNALKKLNKTLLK